LSKTMLKDRFQKMLRAAFELGSSDVHIVPGEPVRIRVDGELRILTENPDSAANCFSSGETEALVREMLSESAWEIFLNRGSADGAFTFEDRDRIRFNIFRQGGRTALALRRLDNKFRSLEELGLSDELLRVCQFKYGLVLIAGPTGSGKSTTLATLLDQINQTRSCHIITIENPVEYIHKSSKSLVSQRQIGIDCPRFDQALVDALRQDPDVILVGEIRDLDTIRTAITAAETGHLVFASVHAGDAVGAIERLVGVFPAEEQTAVQRLLGMVVRCIVAQHLIAASVTTADSRSRSFSKNGQQKQKTGNSGGRVLASEVLWGTPAVSNLIASGQTRQLVSIMEAGANDGMVTLDSSLVQLFRQRRIPESVVRSLARNPQLALERARNR